MIKPAVTVALLALPLFATSAFADTTTVEADTLVVVTPNPPVIVQQGGPSAAPVVNAPGAAVMPPSAPAAANGAPQNEDWSNVSHINGVPVKVGERTDYLYTQKKTNISGNPFGPFFGYYDLAVSRALGQNLAATVAISGWDIDYSQGYQISATLPLFFRRTFSGPYLEGGLLMRTDLNNDDYYYDDYGNEYSSMDDSSSWIGPQLMFGWQSTFDSGLNVAFAFGVAKHMNGDNDTDANGYFRVGYAF